MLKSLQSETRLKILEIIISNENGVTSKEISLKLGISQSIALRHLEHLEKDELLKSKPYKPEVGRPGTKFLIDWARCKNREIHQQGNLRIFLDIMEG